MHSMCRDRVVRCTEFILFPTHHMHCNCVFTYVTLHDASTGTQRRDNWTAFPPHMAHHDSISISLSATVLYLSCHQHAHAFTSTFMHYTPTFLALYSTPLLSSSSSFSSPHSHTLPHPTHLSLSTPSTTILISASPSTILLKIFPFIIFVFSLVISHFYFPFLFCL